MLFLISYTMKINTIAINLMLIISIALAALFPDVVLGDSQNDYGADKVLVIKSEKLLLLLKNGEILKSYKVALGKKPGPKVRQGDKRTPEGLYIIDRRYISKKFYKSLHISYPNPSDIARAQKSGDPPGDDLEIHGLPKEFEDLGTFQSKLNWTRGCIAVSNAEIDEIWELVANGTPVKIIP
jgi:murein L,D-transpeptidase YafK